MVVFSGISVLFVVLTVLSSPHLQVQSSQDHRLNDVIMSKIANFSVDPCEDFYEYACGNFINVFPNPRPRHTWKIKHSTQDKIWTNLEKMLQEDKIENSKAVNMARKYFRECISHVVWEDETPLLQVIKEFKHWPLYSYNKNWTYERHFGALWSFEDFMQKAIKYQAFPFLQISIEKHIPAMITLTKPEFKESQYDQFKEVVADTLRRLENALRKTRKEAVKAKMQTIFVDSLIQARNILINYPDHSLRDKLLSYEASVIKTVKWIEYLYEFEMVEELDEDKKKIVYEMWKIEQELRELEQKGEWLKVPLMKLNNGINITWPCDMQRLLTRYLNGTLPNLHVTIYGYESYFSNLTNVLKKYTKRTVASYIVWKVIYSLTTKMVNTPYKSLDEGRVDWNSRSESAKKTLCFNEVKERFVFAFTRIYADKYISHTSREAISEIAKDIKLEASRQKFHFFDDESWRNAEAKINKSDLSILYPDFILDDKQLDDYYHLYDGGYLSMNIQHAIMLTHLQREKLHDTYDQKYWPSEPVQANAFYHHYLNRIYIFASLESLFPFEAPPEMKYGNLGVVVGHELGHSILFNGWLLNETGAYGKWITNATYHNFQDTEKCYIDFYSNMTMFGRKIDGERVISETMPDVLGLYVAYKALERVLGAQLDKKTSANLNLTKAQTFFLSYAQSDCAVYYAESSWEMFQNHHPFENIRIKGTLQNSQEFAKAFNCKVGSTYNPENKCFTFVKSSQDHRLNDTLMSKIANFSADPCEDFYEYACGNFINVFPNPRPRHKWKMKHSTQDEIMTNLKRMLHEDKKENSKAVNMARKYFRECISHGVWEDETPLLQVIKEFKHWPLYSYNKNWTYERHFGALWSFEDFMQKALKYQTFPFIQISIKKHVRAMIRLTKPEFKESQYDQFKEVVADTLRRLENALRKTRKETIKAKMLTIYIDLLRQKGDILLNYPYDSLSRKLISYNNLVILTVNGIKYLYENEKVEKLDEDIEKIVYDMWKMEQELRELEQKGECSNLPHMTNNRTNITMPCDMQKLLTQYLNGTWPNLHVTIYGYESYFFCLTNVLKKYTKRTVASYIVWKVIYSLTTKMVNTPYKSLDEGRVDWNSRSESSKETLCFNEVKERFVFAFTRIYADKYVDHTSREAMSRIANDIKIEALRQKFHFFDDESWRIAKAKINKTEILTLYPDFILDDEQLDDYYHLYDGGYLSMNIQHAIMLTHLQREKLHDTYDQKYWPREPVQANALYHNFLNRIYILASLESLFPFSAPPEIQYGNFGIVVGHELGHSVLFNGWLVDENGAIRKWITNAASHNYQDTEKCYIDLYSNITMFERNIDGERVIHETIPDEVGLYLAYKALERILGGQLEDKTFANLNLTKAQTFFLSSAQSDCAVYYAETSWGIFLSHHPFENIRIKGTLQNSHDFAKAFNCKVGSTYNPERKCQLY